MEGYPLPLQAFPATDLSSTSYYNPSASTTTSGLTWVNISSNISANISYGYFVNQGSSNIVITLPVAPPNGSVVAVQCVPPTNNPTATGFSLSCISGQRIAIGGGIKGSGQGWTTIYTGAAVTLVYNLSTATWNSVSVVGFFS